MGKGRGVNEKKTGIYLTSEKTERGRKAVLKTPDVMGFGGQLVHTRRGFPRTKCVECTAVRGAGNSRGEKSFENDQKEGRCEHVKEMQYYK